MEVYLKTRAEWRKWLEENYSNSEGVWFTYYKKPSGQPSVPYKDAVEEALCFGWIDGKIKRINDDYYIQWFTPRRRGSHWSTLNMSRAQKLIEQNLMRPAGLKEYELAIKNPAVQEKKPENGAVLPDDLLDGLKENDVAFNNFMKFPSSTRKLYILWVNDAKRAETRIRRIKKVVERSEKNIKAGIL
jgi:uncharacterized protein YdeI (YjbR/CyaY-like superfamily)